MKSEQIPLVALTALEKMTSQLLQQNISMAPNQSLIQFLSILPESEYEVEKELSATDLSRTENRSSWRFVPDSRTCNVSAKRLEGGRTPGMLSGPTLEGGLAGNIIPRPAPEVGERDERVEVVEGVGITRMKRKIRKRRPAAGLVGVRLTKIKGAKCKRCGETEHKPVRCPDQICGVCGGKSHSVEVCANVVTVLACENISRSLMTKVMRPSAARKRRPSYATCQANVTMSRMMRGVVVRSLGKWGISRLYAIVGQHVTCLTHQPELCTTPSRTLTCGRRAVRDTQ